MPVALGGWQRPGRQPGPLAPCQRAVSGIQRPPHATLCTESSLSPLPPPGFGSLGSAAPGIMKWKIPEVACHPLCPARPERTHPWVCMSIPGSAEPGPGTEGLCSSPPPLTATPQPHTVDASGGSACSVVLSAPVLHLLLCLTETLNPVRGECVRTKPYHGCETVCMFRQPRGLGTTAPGVRGDSGTPSNKLTTVTSRGLRGLSKGRTA